MFTETVTSVSFTRDSQCCLVSTQDSTLRLMDKDTGELLNEYTGHTNSSYKIDSCLNDKDTHIFSGSEDGKVYIWDLIEAKVLHTLSNPGGKVIHSLCHHPTEPVLLTVAGGNLHVWKVE